MMTFIWIAIIHEVVVFGFLFFSASRIGKLKTQIGISKANEEAIGAQYEKLLVTFEKYRQALAKSNHSEYVHIELQSDPSEAAQPSAAANVSGTSK